MILVESDVVFICQDVPNVKFVNDYYRLHYYIACNLSVQFALMSYAVANVCSHEASEMDGVETSSEWPAGLYHGGWM